MSQVVCLVYGMLLPEEIRAKIDPDSAPTLAKAHGVEFVMGPGCVLVGQVLARLALRSGPLADTKPVSLAASWKIPKLLVALGYEGEPKLKTWLVAVEEDTHGT